MSFYASKNNSPCQVPNKENSPNPNSNHKSKPAIPSNNARNFTNNARNLTNNVRNSPHLIAKKSSPSTPATAKKLTKTVSLHNPTFSSSSERRFQRPPLKDLAEPTKPSKISRCSSLSRVQGTSDHTNGKKISSETIIRNAGSKSVKPAGMKKNCDLNPGSSGNSKTLVSKSHISNTNVSKSRISSTYDSKSHISSTHVSKSKISKTHVQKPQISKTQNHNALIFNTHVPISQISKIQNQNALISNTHVPKSQISKTLIHNAQTSNTLLLTPRSKSCSLLGRKLGDSGSNPSRLRCPCSSPMLRYSSCDSANVQISGTRASELKQRGLSRYGISLDGGLRNGSNVNSKEELSSDSKISAFSRKVFTKASQDRLSSTIGAFNENAKSRFSSPKEKDDSQGRSLYQTPLLVQAKKVEFSRSPFSGGLGEFTPSPSCAVESVGRSEAAHENSSTPEQRAQVTPPVQPSISPEIHSQEVAQDAGNCFSAGHVMAPVSSKGKVKDRRKCRPRGILIVGEAKPLPLDDDHPRFSLLPDPAVASVKWISPRQGQSQSSPSNGVSPKSVNSQCTPTMCYNKNSPVLIAASHDSHLASSTKSKSPGYAAPRSERRSPDKSLSSNSPLSQTTIEHPHKYPNARVSHLLRENADVVAKLGQEWNQDCMLLGKLLVSGLSPEMEKFKQSPPEMEVHEQISPTGLTPEMQSFLPTPPSESLLRKDFSKLCCSYCLNSSSVTPPSVTSATKFENSSSCNRLNSCHSAPPLFGVSDECSTSLKMIDSSEYQVDVAGSKRVPFSSRDIHSRCPSESRVSKRMGRGSLNIFEPSANPASKDLWEPRISWRGGLMNQIFDLEAFNCPGLILDDQAEKDTEIQDFEGGKGGANLKTENSQQSLNALNSGAAFGSIEYINESADINGSYVRSCSADPPMIEDECQDTKNMIRATGLDWAFWYKNQLYEEAG